MEAAASAPAVSVVSSEKLCSVWLVQGGAAQARAMGMAGLINSSQQTESALLKRLENKC